MSQRESRVEFVEAAMCGLLQAAARSWAARIRRRNVEAIDVQTNSTRRRRVLLAERLIQSLDAERRSLSGNTGSAARVSRIASSSRRGVAVRRAERQEFLECGIAASMCSAERLAGWTDSLAVAKVPRHHHDLRDTFHVARLSHRSSASQVRRRRRRLLLQRGFLRRRRAVRRALARAML